MSTTLQYDPAGNRSNYSVTGSGVPGGGGGGGGTANNAPVANTDYLSLVEWQSGVANVVANDTDPDGDYPLTVTAISDTSGHAYLASSTEVGWYGSAAGNYTVRYTLRDNRGATSTGTLNVSVSGGGGSCGTNRYEVCP